MVEKEYKEKEQDVCRWKAEAVSCGVGQQRLREEEVGRDGGAQGTCGCVQCMAMIVC
jgi:hypothetical protein